MFWEAEFAQVLHASVYMQQVYTIELHAILFL